MPMPPANWAQHRAWRVLDAGFAQDRGAQFFATWQAWRQDPKRPRMLHYVALCGPQAPALRALDTAAAPADGVRALEDQWFGLLPGFHRLVLDGGQLLLTLCVGEPAIALRELDFQPDAIYSHDAAPAMALQPPPFASQVQPGHCIVVGAGLAGASVAAALARRGVPVDVLDAAGHPAAGASGLPAGLMAPLASGDDGTRSRLSRAGLRSSLQQARALLREGEDWGASGVLERGLKGDVKLPPQWLSQGQAWSELATPDGPQPSGVAHLAAPSALWHRAGAWVKPAALVRAWLATEGVRFQPHAAVARLHRAGDGWTLLDEQGQSLAQGSHVVLANAWGAQALAAPWLPARPRLSSVQGQVSWAAHGENEPPLPPCPVNGLGSFIPQVPQAGHRAWYAGATFEHDPLTVAQAHEANATRLARLVPEAAGLLDRAVADGQAQAWRGTRCTSADRLPVVGRLTPPHDPASLWLSTAMGARGLTLSVLCAELLAAQMCGEPLPVEASLARLLDVRRGN